MAPVLRGVQQCRSHNTEPTWVVRVGAGRCLLLDSPRLPLPMRLCPHGLDGPVDQPMLKAAAPAAGGLRP